MEINFQFITILKININILSIVFSLYLLYDDFILFFSKPTFSSDNERILKPENFPGIFVCPMPAYNMSQLKRHGYMTSYHYIMGNIKNENYRTWAGNGSVEIDKVANDVAMIKGVNDCPSLTVMYSAIKKDDRVKFELAYTGSPPGLCCRAIIPENANEDSVETLIFHVPLSMNPNMEGFQIFLSNQESFHKFKMLEFNTNGILLKAYQKKPGDTIFRIKIHDHIRLEEDPKIQCKVYQKKLDYSKVKIFITFHIFFDCFFQCLNDDFKKQALNTFNCSPPYITDDKNHWCTSLKNLSSKQNERLYEYIALKMESKNCFSPCKLTK